MRNLKIKLRTGIVIFFMVLAVLLFTISGIYLTRNTGDLLEDEMSLHLEAIAKAKEAHLLSVLDRHSETVNLLSINEQLVEEMQDYYFTLS
ncbi:MAG: hypothetical protein ABIF92_01700 [archaeon]